MAKVTWSAGIDHVSGALSKPGKNGQHSCAKMLLATHRVAATQSTECNRLYLRPKVKRSTEASQRELNNRARFAAVRTMVKARSHNLEYLSTDQEAFLAQKDTPGGKTTLQAYYWKICGDQYDAQHGS